MYADAERMQTQRAKSSLKSTPAPLGPTPETPKPTDLDDGADLFAPDDDGSDMHVETGSADHMVSKVNCVQTLGVTATDANAFDLLEIGRVFRSFRQLSRAAFLFIRSSNLVTAFKLVARRCLADNSANSFSRFRRLSSSAALLSCRHALS